MTWEEYRANRQRYFNLVDQRMSDLKIGKETPNFQKRLLEMETVGNKLRRELGLVDTTHGPVFCEKCRKFYSPPRSKYACNHTVHDCELHKTMTFICEKENLTEERYETN